MEGSSSNRAVMMNVNNNASSSSEAQQNHLYPLQSSPLASPTGNFSNPNGGGGRGHQIPRSDNHHHHNHHNHHMNPYPTTFVQANTSTFKQVVQILTGSADTAKQASSPRPQDPMRGSTNFPIPPIRSIPNKKQQQQQQQQQLYERRSSSFKHRSLMINTLLPAAGRFGFNNSNSNFISSSSSPSAEILSPSLLDFPKLTLSPVTPLNQDPFFHGNNSSCPSSAGNCSSSSSSSSPPLEEEDRAIAEKGFYLHPSPRSTPRESEPQLLTLFPLTSPRAGESPPPEP